MENLGLWSLDQDPKPIVEPVDDGVRPLLESGSSAGLVVASPCSLHDPAELLRGRLADERSEDDAAVGDDVEEISAGGGVGMRAPGDCWLVSPFSGRYQLCCGLVLQMLPAVPATTA